ncbi:MAG: MBL fold metallo-hydrolase [Gammaproteobacteria bacterium]|nr:MBL fold metallo-hydrolase [Gammaproteobacteria bacterium]
MTENFLRFWGVRGSYPSPYPSHMGIGGNTPCVELRLGDEIVILDAGTGIIPLGNQLASQTELRRLHILLTHYHWDHISGLPFFVPAFMPGFEISMHGPAESAEELKGHLDAQMRAPYFPVETETWLASIDYFAGNDRPIKVGPASISTFVLHHPGLTVGYRIEIAGRVILYAPDNEVFFINQSIDKRKDEFDEEERSLLEVMKAEHKLRVIEFMQDADILIHDAQYTPKDYSAKRGWGHSCYIDTVNAAIDAGVKDLFLFSYDPNYDDNAIAALHQSTLDIITERCSQLRCHMTHEGLIVPIGG